MRLDTREHYLNIVKESADALSNRGLAWGLEQDLRDDWRELVSYHEAITIAGQDKILERVEKANRILREARMNRAV